MELLCNILSKESSSGFLGSSFKFRIETRWQFQYQAFPRFVKKQQKATRLLKKNGWDRHGLASLESPPHDYWHGPGVGWFSSTKFQVPIGSKEVSRRGERWKGEKIHETWRYLNTNFLKMLEKCLKNAWKMLVEVFFEASTQRLLTLKRVRKPIQWFNSVSACLIVMGDGAVCEWEWGVIDPAISIQ